MKKVIVLAGLALSLGANADRKGVLGIRYSQHPEGLLVTKVNENSGASAAGLAVGDLIVTVDSADVRSEGPLPPLKGEPGSTVALGVVRAFETESETIAVTRGLAARSTSTSEDIAPAVARFAGALRRDGGPKVRRAVRGLVAADYGGAEAAQAIGQRLVRAAKSRKAAARAALKEFEKVQNKPPGLLFKMGEAHFTLGDYGEAKKWLQRALDAYPDDTARALGARGRAEEMLANALWETGERQAAIDLTRQLARYRRILPLTKKVGMADPTPEQRWAIELPPLADFSTDTLSTEEWSLSDHLGKPVVLVFWATWCGPCKKEMPALAKLVRERPDWPVSFLAVSVDDDRAAAKVDKMVSEWDLPFPVTRNAELMERFGVSSLPSMRVIGPRGSLRSSSRGYSESSVAKLAETVDSLVAEAESAVGEKAAAFPFGSGWADGRLNMRGLSGIDGVRYIAATSEGVSADLAGHGGLPIPIASGVVSSAPEVEESLKSKQDEGVAWFDGPLSFGDLWVRARTPSGGARWFRTLPSQIQSVATSGEQLWIALDDQIVVLDSSGALVLRVELPVKAIAEAQDGGVWAVDGSDRLRIGPTGEVLLRDDAPGAAHITGDGLWATSDVVALISGAFGPKGAPRTVGINKMGLIVGLDGQGNAALRVHIDGAEASLGPSISSADLDGDGQDELVISSWGRGIATLEVEIP